MAEEGDENYYHNIIIDNGTGYCKIGFSNEEGPRAVFPSCLGYPKYYKGMIGSNDREFYIGYDAISRRGVLKLNYPIEHGVINNWDDMEKIWGHAFTNELRADPVEHNILLTEAPYNPRENREKIAQIMFETFNVPKLYIALQAVLSLYSAGKNTGVVVDSGDGVTHCVPIFEGYCLPHAIMRLDIAGRDLTEYLMRLMHEIGFRPNTTSEKDIVKRIKEECCYVALNFNEEKGYVDPYDYELPDGNHIIIKDQRIRCPETLFTPSLMGKEGEGIVQMCYNCIERCDIDLKKEFYYNILLSGGTSTFRGFAQRLYKDINSILREQQRFMEIRVLPKDDDKENEKEANNNSNIGKYNIKYAVWQGGAIASKLSTFQSNWITKDEYEESGATIVHRKCF